MKKLAILLSLVLLTACGPDRPEYKERAADEIYAQGLEYLDDTNWHAAAIEFTEIERQHPESDLAAQGMYMTAYAYFKGDKHVEAIDALNHFLKLHPAHKNVDYVLYLKSIIYYDEISDVRREQHATVEALKTMEQLTEQFPKSPYTKNVKAKIAMLENYLAGKEMFIARKLLKEENHLAALKRFQLVIAKWPKTIMRPEALYRMAEIYKAIHLPGQVDVMRTLLEKNHPDSEWTEKVKELKEK